PEGALRQYRKALELQGSFGPEHVQYPRLLQQLGRHSEALDQYSSILDYSHRYASEYIEPSWEPHERLPRDNAGRALDPARMSPVSDGGNRRFYWCHLYFAVPS